MAGAKDNMQACARICVEVDLGRGLPEAIKLKVGDWSHIQQLDYEQIPFKCKVCHEYGHFANRCTKIVNAENDEQDGHWEPVKKKKAAPPPSLPRILTILVLLFSVLPPPLLTLLTPFSPIHPSLPPPTPFLSFPLMIPFLTTPPLSPQTPINIKSSLLNPLLSPSLQGSPKAHLKNMEHPAIRTPGKKSTKQHRDENA